MTEQRKIVVFTKSKERVLRISDILSNQGVDFATNKGVIYHDLLGVSIPDYHQTLVKWAAKGFTECIIDSGTFTKDCEVVPGVKAYATDANKPAGSVLRPIVIFPKSADPMATVYSQLVNVGIYDFIIPQVATENGLDYLEEACKLVSNPRAYAEVQAYRRENEEQPAPEPAKKAVKEAAVKVETVIQTETVRVPAPTSRKVIAVATCAKRGGSTVLALRLARALYHMHQNVAVLTDTKTVRSLWSFMAERSSNGRGGIPVPLTFQGVDFFEGSDVSVLPNGYDYAIIDFGYADFSKMKDDEMPEKFTKATLNADARYLCVPMGTPSDWQDANNMALKTRQQLDKWAVCFWGLGGESTKLVANQIRLSSPKAVLVQLGFTEFPMALGEAEPMVVDTLCATHVISNALRKKYGTKATKDESEEAAETVEQKSEPAKKRKGLFSRKGKAGEENG